MRVLVTGSRSWTATGPIRREISLLTAMPYAGPALADDGSPLTLVHGGARGADTFAAEFAESLGWLTEVHRPAWDEYGKAAGLIRNREMLESNIQLVLVFRHRYSSGTSFTLNLAMKMEIPVILWDCPDLYPNATRREFFS